ncbi:hypothetical protein LJR007_000541 [Aminobacter sp. LjRoot7]
MDSDGKFTLRLSPIVRLMMTLDDEMSLDQERLVFNEDRREKFQKMHLEALGKRDQLFKGVAILDAAILLLLYGRAIEVPGLGINLIDVPAGLEIATTLASLAFMFASLAFFNEQAYLAIVNKFGEKFARPAGVDPDFVNASEGYFEFFLKLYGSQMNIWRPDVFVPGRGYRWFFGSLLVALQLSLMALLVLHLMAIGAACASLWQSPSAYYISQAVAALAVVSNAVGLLVVFTMNVSFSFTVNPIGPSPR